MTEREKLSSPEMSEESKGASVGEPGWAVFAWIRKSKRWWVFIDTVARTKKGAIERYDGTHPGWYEADKEAGRCRAMRCAVVLTHPTPSEGKNVR